MYLNKFTVLFIVFTCCIFHTCILACFIFILDVNFFANSSKFQLENCPLDRKTFIVKQDDDFVINRVITQGEVRSVLFNYRV